ncbi:hypothetical protein C8J56DRAFT_953166 [Mycena floridula]|nr:hypothetical protein C8J56DRAFT_953166 [Mycena floridula]
MPPRESIHVERARRWETNSFLAEWFDRAVKYCKGPGKAAFESWLISTHGSQKAGLLISQCTATPQLLPNKKYPGKGIENAQNWNKASVELGVTDETMKLYFSYATTTDCCTPERTLPPPRRRRHENSSQWIARRNSALLEGHQGPNFDWETVRAIAISELDRVRDLAIVRRSDLAPFLEEMQRRAKSTIPSPEIVALGEEAVQHRTMTDAFRSTTFISHISHRCWKHATDVFEYLARKGLCTASAIERAYLRDEDLMWRLFACGVLAFTLGRELWGKISQVITFCPYYKPYFRRWRSKFGVANIEVNHAYWSNNTLKTDLDCFIINHIASEDLDTSYFFTVLTRELAAHPEEAAKFSEEAFEVIGDFAVVKEFLQHFLHTPFGATLKMHALNIAGDQILPGMYKYLCPLDPKKLGQVTASEKPVTFKPFGPASAFDVHVVSQWHNNEIALQDAINRVIILGDTPSVRISSFEAMWEVNDRILWDTAKSWDRPNEPGRVAREFGLLDPDDPNRPTYAKGILKLLMGATETPAPAASVKEPSEYVQSFLVAAPGEGVMSGHAYTKDSKDSGPKSKPKTTGTVKTVTEVKPDPDQTLDDFPDILPKTFKLPKKILKVFHNILEVERETQGDPNAPKKGQVRWGDFEKAMKRLGFDIIQTAGSSVRFDPPAKTARPISFHRPHPDSILPPHMLKAVGARLKRTYGWTMGTFDLAMSSSEE